MGFTNGQYYLDVITANGDLATTTTSALLVPKNYNGEDKLFLTTPAVGSRISFSFTKSGQQYYYETSINESRLITTFTFGPDSFRVTIRALSSNTYRITFTVDTYTAGAVVLYCTYFIQDYAAGVRATATSKTASNYNPVANSYTYGGYTYTTISLDHCYYQCTNFTTAPTLPTSVQNLAYAFSQCSKLTGFASGFTIPNSVTNMDNTFSHTKITNFTPTIPASVTNVCGTFASMPNLTGNINVANNPPNNANATLTFLNTTKPIYIVSSSGSTLSTWQAIASTYSNVHYEADDSSMPSIVVQDIFRAGSNTGTTPPAFDASGKFVYIKFSYFKLGEANGLLPNGWTSNYSLSFKKDGSNLTSGYNLYEGTSGANGNNKFYHNTNNLNKHTFTITVTSQAKSGNTLKGTAKTSSVTVELSPPFAAIDFYHDSSVTDPSKGAIGVAFGTYANAVEFRVDNMRIAFADDVYLDLDLDSTHTTDANLRAAITALSWDSAVYNS